VDLSLEDMFIALIFCTIIKYLQWDQCYVILLGYRRLRSCNAIKIEDFPRKTWSCNECI